MQQDNKDQVITLNAFQSWKAQSNFAWIQTPQYKSARVRRTHALTARLATGILMFLGESHDRQTISRTTHDTIIEPGLVLKEQMAATKHDCQVFLDIGSSSEMSKVDSEREEYLDITDNHRQVKDIALSGPDAVKILGTISPCCTFTALQSDDRWGGFCVVSRQQRLVARARDLDRIVLKNERKDEPLFFSSLVS